MVDHRTRLEHDHARRRMVDQSVAHVHVVVIVRMEVPDRHQIVPPHGHGGPDHMLDRSDGLRQSEIGTPEHPVVLVREPRGSRLRVVGYRSSPDGDDRRVVERSHHLLEPVGLGRSVVVEECDVATGGQFRGRGPRRAQVAVIPVLHHLDGHSPPTGRLAPPLHAPLEQVGVVVDRQEELLRLERLVEDRLDRPGQQVPPVEGVRTDDHRDVRRSGIVPRGCRRGFGCGRSRPPVLGRRHDGVCPSDRGSDRRSGIGVSPARSGESCIHPL